MGEGLSTTGPGRGRVPIRWLLTLHGGGAAVVGLSTVTDSDTHQMNTGGVITKILHDSNARDSLFLFTLRKGAVFRLHSDDASICD